MILWYCKSYALFTQYGKWCTTICYPKHMRSRNEQLIVPHRTVQTHSIKNEHTKIWTSINIGTSLDSQIWRIFFFLVEIYRCFGEKLWFQLQSANRIWGQQFQTLLCQFDRRPKYDLSEERCDETDIWITVPTNARTCHTDGFGSTKYSYWCDF